MDAILAQLVAHQSMVVVREGAQGAAPNSS
jgi:hypothetical protein